MTPQPNESVKVITEFTFNGQQFPSSISYTGEKSCINCIHFRPLLTRNIPGIHEFVCGQQGDKDELPVYNEATACQLFYQEAEAHSPEGK
jgi:hypothetical protein